MTKLKHDLAYFAQEVISLSSEGIKESISVVEEHIDNGDLASYICSKYNLARDNKGILERLDKKIGEFAGCLVGEEDREYGISEENDGLLLIVTVVIEILKTL